MISGKNLAQKQHQRKNSRTLNNRSNAYYEGGNNNNVSIMRSEVRKT